MFFLGFEVLCFWFWGLGCLCFTVLEVLRFWVFGGFRVLRFWGFRVLGFGVSGSWFRGFRVFGYC